MASKTDICNFALTFVGADRITAVTDDNERARICDLFYDQARLEVLQAHTWGPAIKLDSLSADATDPVWGFDHRYQLPSDHIRMISIESVGQRRWEIQDEYVATDEDSPLKIKYVFDLSDTTQMSPMMVRAIAQRLAVHIVEKLTNSNTKKAQLEEQYERTINDAKAFDGQERSPVRIADPTWVSSRDTGIITGISDAP
jgi:hypothetical protein